MTFKVSDHRKQPIKAKLSDQHVETDNVRRAITELIYSFKETDSAPDVEHLRVLALAFEKIQLGIMVIAEDDKDIKTVENIAQIKLSRMKTLVAKTLGFTAKRGAKISAKKTGYDTARKYHGWVSQNSTIHTAPLPKERAKEIFEETLGVSKSTLENYYRKYEHDIRLDFCFALLEASTRTK